MSKLLFHVYWVNKLKKTKTTCKCPEVSLKTSKAGLGSADVTPPVEEVVVEEVVEEEVVVRGLIVEVGSEATMGRRKGRKAIFENI